MQPRPWPEPAPEVAAAIAAMYRGRRQAPLPVTVRDELGELFADSEFVSAFGAEGRPGWSPGRLALATVLQRAENLTDRQAAETVRRDLSWKYALGLALEDEGFDASVLSEFRSRVVAHGLEERALDLLLAALKDKGLVKAGGAQRTDSTHVISAVRDLNRLELAGECVRACLEALSAAAPDWVEQVLEVPGWAGRYRARVDTWRLPSSQVKRDELARSYGADAYALVEAVYAPFSPVWLRELPAVQALRVMLVQNYIRLSGRNGREVIKMRRSHDEGGEGLPPGRYRLSSPYDTDARWAAKGEDLVWNGYKVHISETCRPADDDHDGQGQGRTPPNLITSVLTTDATVPDVTMTDPVHQALARRGLLPAEHYLDSGYPSADLLVSSRHDYGITLVTPMLTDVSAQARAGSGFDRASFTIDWQAAGHLPPRSHLRLLEPRPPARHRDDRGDLLRRRLRPVPGPRPVHHLQEETPSAHHPAPADPASHGRCPRRTEHPRLASQIRSARRCRGHRPPSRRGHRDPPRPLLRPAQSAPRTHLLRSRPEPDPPGRLVERPPPRPAKNQPPRPPRTRRNRAGRIRRS